MSPLSPAEVRVLGSLVEKAVTTPDYYPLSLGALTNACNQLTSRDPVVAYDEGEVTRAVEGLRERKLATMFHGAESRVPKFKHLLTDAFLLTPAEVAILCVLLLRGPQTVGELRGRTERLHSFDSLAEVEESIASLASHTPYPLVAKAPRQPGTKEARYAHLLSGPPGGQVSPESPDAGRAGVLHRPSPERPVQDTCPTSLMPDLDRLAILEEETAAIRRELADMKQQLADFRKQFE